MRAARVPRLNDAKSGVDGINRWKLSDVDDVGLGEVRHVGLTDRRTNIGQG